ncbi:MAG: Asp-tRNA(Asn)/Glu-tRNA(Gln) amidotransferase subunit GatB [Candidatus Yanofskybacteria bacterium]|nr:Asp-tRNA(Asn)/Glu-tRNA(Gln) amidotransferase subunit GatB [Candidatus Yanofskybacteria bacterium]
MKYKPVIGLEIHAELNTKTKMFCDSLNDPDEKHPNINICPICLSHPGTLPVANEDAVKKVIMAGLALNCQIERDTFFERKNYFYPDLPKGYQISQYQKPLCYSGELKIKSPSTSSGFKAIRITRIHLEEDAGRLYHLPDKNYSLVDFNRAGVPLMELVTEPDLESGEEVRKFAEELQLILRYLGVSDADMEKGQMRVEVNISLMDVSGEKLEVSKDNSHLSPPTPHVSKLGTKVEVKNINSIKFAADAVDYEIRRQTELLEAGEKVKQETRGWDEKKGETYLMRSKEEAQDYRYFPEPDLPPLHFEDADIEDIKSQLPELPQQRRTRFTKRYGLSERYVEIFVVNKQLGDYYEHVASELDSAAKDYHLRKELEGALPDEPHISGKLHSIAANYIITEFPTLTSSLGQELDIEGLKISPEAFAELMVLIFHKELSSTGAKTVLKEMAETGLHPEQIMKEKDLSQVSDISELEASVDKVIVDNPKAVEDYKRGKEASLKFLIGMVMKGTRGRANPQLVEEILRKTLS